MEVRVQKLASYEDGSSEHLLTFIRIDHLIQAQSLAMIAHFEEAVTATASHEQLNPLNSIISFSDYLLS